jgi:hypothetical protein
MPMLNAECRQSHFLSAVDKRIRGALVDCQGEAAAAL